MKIARLLSVLALIALVTSVPTALADDVTQLTLPCIADTMVSNYPSEQDLNCGGRTVLRLKGTQGIVFMQFDVSQAAGMEVQGARLYIYSDDTTDIPFNVTSISTIVEPWVEGDGNYTIVWGASCWNWREYNTVPWLGDPSHKASEVCLGANGSLVNSNPTFYYVDTGEPGIGGGKWSYAHIDPELVQALIDGRAYGLALYQPSIYENDDIRSREQYGKEPYLVVWGLMDTTAPGRITDLQVLSTGHGRATLQWTAPGDDGYQGRASTYEIRWIEGTLNEITWTVANSVANPPTPSDAGTVEVFEVTDLPPGATIQLGIKTSDGANWSELSNVVTIEVPLDSEAPAAVTDLQASSGLNNGYINLQWTAPADAQDGKAYAYDIRYSTGPIDESNWASATQVQNIPPPADAGTVQRLVVTGLTPGQTYYFALKSRDYAGNWSAISNLASAQATSTALNIWVVSDHYKINPITGNAKELGNYTGSPDESRRVANEVWDSATKTIHLRAARKEVAAFQIILERVGSSVTNVNVSVSDLAGPVTISSSNCSLFRAWYLYVGDAWYPDVMVPFPHHVPFDIPDGWLNVGSAQKNQSIWVDYYLPPETWPGTYTGTVTITSDQRAETLNLVIDVPDLTIVEWPSFTPELNDYGSLRDQPEREYNVRRLAHLHRMSHNAVPYSQSGVVANYGETGPNDQAFAPEIAGTGASATVTDWSRYDAHYDQYLSGEAFAGLQRDRVPERILYLPFHENWPSQYKTYPAPSADLTPALYNGFSDAEFWATDRTDYEAKYKAILRQFEQHFNQKGYRWTMIFVYFNNKEHWGYIPWNLDEPTRQIDYNALNYFAGLTHDALQYDGPCRIIYRLDLGHPEYDVSSMDESIDLWNLNWGTYDSNYGLVKSKAEYWRSLGHTIWLYGSLPKISDSSLKCFNWAYGAWDRLASGICAWLTLDWASDEWVDADRYTGGTGACLAMYRADRLGMTNDVIPSMRLKQIRQAAQDYEWMNFITERDGGDRSVADAIVAAALASSDPADWLAAREQLLDEALARRRLVANGLRVGTDGGIVQAGEGSAYANVQLEVPAGSLSGECFVGIREAGDLWGATGCSVDVQVFGGEVVGPLKLTLEFKPQDVVGGTPEQMRIAKLDREGGFVWVDVGGHQVVSDLGGTYTVTAWIDGPGQYAAVITGQTRRAGDVNGDGHVNVLDLMELVNAWGSTVGDENYNANADFDVSGSVNVLDLMMLVNEWGT